MSSILKALRKLEEERARKRETPPEIATSILRVDARRKLLPLWLWPAVVIGGMLLVAAVFWSLRPAAAPPDAHSAPGGSNASVASRSASAETIVEEILDTRVPAVPVAVAPRTARIPVAPSGQIREPLPYASPSNTKTILPVATAPLSTPPSGSSSMSVESAPLLAPSLPTTAPLAAHSRPLISAIVWQEDRASRLAVVDGLPMMEGELAGSAKIEEIQTDNVVFSENGLKFSVPIKGE